jgi:hypothetical protein
MLNGVHSVLITPVSVASRQATGWTAGVGFPAGARFFSSPQCPYWFWGETKLLSSEYRGVLSQEVKTFANRNYFYVMR